MLHTVHTFNDYHSLCLISPTGWIDLSACLLNYILYACTYVCTYVDSVATVLLSLCSGWWMVKMVGWKLYNLLC